MKIRRLVINAISVIALALSVYILINANNKDDSSTMAASLAVITAVISTWSSQKVIWKQEDDLEPDLNVGFDLDSRSGIIQFLITNKGGGNAYDVTIEWINPFKGIDGKVLNIRKISTFLKGETYRVFAAASVETFKKASELNKELIFTGNVLFKLNKKDRRHRTSFFEVSLEPYRIKVSPYSDQQEYYLKNTQVPKILKQINDSIEELTNVLKERK